MLVVPVKRTIRELMILVAPQALLCTVTSLIQNPDVCVAPSYNSVFNGPNNYNYCHDINNIQTLNGKEINLDALEDKVKAGIECNDVLNSNVSHERKKKYCKRRTIHGKNSHSKDINDEKVLSKRTSKNVKIGDDASIHSSNMGSEGAKCHYGDDLPENTAFEHKKDNFKENVLKKAKFFDNYETFTNKTTGKRTIRYKTRQDFVFKIIQCVGGVFVSEAGALLTFLRAKKTTNKQNVFYYDVVSDKFVSCTSKMIRAFDFYLWSNCKKRNKEPKVNRDPNERYNEPSSIETFYNAYGGLNDVNINKGKRIKYAEYFLYGLMKKHFWNFLNLKPVKNLFIERNKIIKAEETQYFNFNKFMKESEFGKETCRIEKRKLIAGKIYINFTFGKILRIVVLLDEVLYKSHSSVYKQYIKPSVKEDVYEMFRKDLYETNCDSDANSIDDDNVEDVSSTREYSAEDVSSIREYSAEDEISSSNDSLGQKVNPSKNDKKESKSSETGIRKVKESVRVKTAKRRTLKKKKHKKRKAVSMNNAVQPFQPVGINENSEILDKDVTTNNAEENCSENESIGPLKDNVGENQKKLFYFLQSISHEDIQMIKKRVLCICIIIGICGAVTYYLSLGDFFVSYPPWTAF
ncbi:hypothetical protein ENBRE01_1627 [Enteropsectra breve]|nr:hypothetical protein ENBRE01_1627 [Enteropsectra breve]